MRRRPSPWIATRANHLDVFPECRVCGVITPSNHVHHLRYRGQRGTSERPGDLVTLCPEDHNALHAALGQRGLAVAPQIDWVARSRGAHAMILSLDAVS